MGNFIAEPKLEKESKKTIIYYSDEEQYIGECNGEVREGAGVYTYANGDKYEGQWLNNVKQGKGYFYYNNGELYIGDWVKNKKSGKGMYFYQTGDRFDGEWEENMKQGEGTYYYVDGTIYHGHFHKSKKHGVGTMKTPEGFVYEEVWEEGQLLTRKIIQKPEEATTENKAKKFTRQKSVSVVTKFAKKPRKPKVTENGLTFMSHLDVSQYVNEKLLHKNINEWKTKDVCDWLDRGGFSQYKEGFSSNHITGRNLFDLTENDLKDDFNINNAVHRKRIMQDLELLKKIYSKNADDNQYIRNKLLRFYEKNQGELFTKKNASTSSRTSINLGGVMVAPAEIADEMTIRNKELKDTNDRQDSLENVSLEQKMASSSTSSSSSETSSNEEQSEATEKEAPGKKAKNQVTKSPGSEQEEKPQLHMSEYRTILDNYQKNDFNLLETIQKTLGKMSVIDYTELEMAQSIGEGGYGEVFKGKWLGQDVAIKVYGRKKVRNKEKIDQDFLREVEVVSRLRHPNIVLFMGVSLTPQGKGFLVTEYLEGGSLFDHLHKKGTKFDETTIINIALDIALGMNYLHGQKILHCDLKSSNILLDEHFNVKLADFGLSKSKRKIHGRKHFKRVGTPHWMAPEIMREEEYDEASDVYSYGMILWELMVKKVPYFGLKVNQIVGSVGYGDKQVPIPETGNEIMITLMKQCLCKTRSGRPTFKEITEYLKDTDRHRKLIAMRELDSFFN